MVSAKVGGRERGRWDWMCVIRVVFSRRGKFDVRVVKMVAREECSVSERRWWWAVGRFMRPEWYCSASQAVVGAVMRGSVVDLGKWRMMKLFRHELSEVP